MKTRHRENPRKKKVEEGALRPNKSDIWQDLQSNRSIDVGSVQSVKRGKAEPGRLTPCHSSKPEGRDQKGGKIFWNKINPKARSTLSSRRRKKSRDWFTFTILEMSIFPEYDYEVIWEEVLGPGNPSLQNDSVWLAKGMASHYFRSAKEWKMIRRAVTSKSSRLELRRLMTNGCMQNETRKEVQSTRRMKRETMKISYRKFATLLRIWTRKVDGIDPGE